jgi:hypothetical protein
LRVGQRIAEITAVPQASGRPAELFSFTRDELFLGASVLTPYAVAPDGQRFYAVKQPPRKARPVADINTVLNWFEELKSQAPVARQGPSIACPTNPARIRPGILS